MTKLLTFEDLRYANVQRNIEWDADNRITGSYRGLELAGEVGELCNKIKKLEREKMGIKGSRTTWMEIASEMGDAQICLDLLAMHYCVSLEEAVKLAFNDKSNEFGFLTRIG